MAHRLLTEFKIFMDYDEEDVTHDNFFDIALGAAERFIENYCGIKLDVDTITSTTNGDSTAVLFLPVLPIGTINSVEVDGVVKDASEYYVSNGAVRLVADVFSAGVQNIVVDYTTGYADIDLPNDIKVSMFRIADKIFKDAIQNRDGIDSFSSQTKMGVNYIQQDLPEGVQLMLNMYRNIRI